MHRWQVMHIWVDAKDIKENTPIEMPAGWEPFGASDGNRWGRSIHLRRLVDDGR